MAKNDNLKNFKEVKIPSEKVFKDVIGASYEFPKYTTQIINLANQNSQGTRPEVVGQMSELIQQSPDKSFEGWKKWYLEKHPDAINKATQKIKPMIDNLKQAIGKIDKQMIMNWVEDLVLVKTAEGLVIQEFILKFTAKKRKLDYRVATPQEESKNIDGFIGNVPVQVKSFTYLSKRSTIREKIPIEIIYYKKTDSYLYIYYL